MSIRPVSLIQRVGERLDMQTDGKALLDSCGCHKYPDVSGYCDPCLKCYLPTYIRHLVTR